ncbi:PREDICTED: uncharacterized protein LOC109158807 [Ipomoea nil]|uniref:uncharacterized protein LOC109158807 n=1 Tax=Ipomoea nil TaxID=35883 RepID=UPI000901BCA1|nr:PREDICTED: uncharacterized protein LOC109158807 [Ipomoea nil]
MSTGEVKKVSREDIQLVQNLIERCLQLYMNQEEVVSTLLHQAKIEPGFTELVWQKLEEENQEFFRAYHLRLIVKDQISRFNELLERHAKLIHQICPAGVNPIPLANGGSQMPPLHENSTCTTEKTGPVVKTETMHRNIDRSLLDAYSNGASSLQTCMQSAFDMSTHTRRINVSPSILLAQNANVGLMQGLNGGMIKSEAGYPSNSHFLFGGDNNVLETRPAITDASISSYSSVESNSQHLNETVLDADSSSFGFLGQIPRNFSLSDLTADFANSSDILGTYSRSPFLASDTDSFLDPLGTREHRGAFAP